MRKTIRNGVSNLALAAVMTTGFAGIDAASAKGKSATIPMPPNDSAARAVPKKKSNWIFPAMGALTVAAAVLIATGDKKPASP